MTTIVHGITLNSPGDAGPWGATEVTALTSIINKLPENQAVATTSVTASCGVIVTPTTVSADSLVAGGLTPTVSHYALTRTGPGNVTFAINSGSLPDGSILILSYSAYDQYYGTTVSVYDSTYGSSGATITLQIGECAMFVKIAHSDATWYPVKGTSR